MAHVALGVRPSCIGILVARPRLGRSTDCARGRGSVGAEIAPGSNGSGEKEIAPEAMVSGEMEITPVAKGSSETDIMPKAKGSGVACTVFCRFFPS